MEHVICAMLFSYNGNDRADICFIDNLKKEIELL